MDGEVVATDADLGGALSGTFRAEVPVGGARWLAARASGRRRTSYGHALWAHTSPVYLGARPSRARAEAAATHVIGGIDATLTWIRTTARFDDDRPARPDARDLRRRARPVRGRPPLLAGAYPRQLAGSSSG